MTSCSVCNYEFDPKETIPKILIECGHTFCCSCIDKVIETSKTCPECRTPMTKTKGKDYPTNFSVLRCQKEKVDDRLEKRRELDDRLEKRRELDDRLEKLRELRSKLMKVKDSLHIISEITDQDIAQIQDILVPKKCETDPRSIDRLIDVVEEHIKDFAPICVDSEMKLDIKLSDFPNPQHFCYEISLHLLQGKKIYAAHVVTSRVMYGKITAENDYRMLKVHSLKQSRVKKAAKIVSLDDLKKCFVNSELRVFLEFVSDYNCYTTNYVIQPNGTPLPTEFFRLCTGEDGPVYVGRLLTRRSRYDTISHSYVDEIVIEKRKKDGNDNQIEGPQELVKHMPNVFKLVGNAFGDPNGKFIIQEKLTQNADITGKITNIKLCDPTLPGLYIISNCGFQIPLN